MPQHTGICPYCDGETHHVNNHIRMSNGEHGPQGRYPDDWDSDTRSRADLDDVDGQTIDVDGADLDDDSGATLILGDDAIDAREYDCGECGANVAYLDRECDECGDALKWTVAA